MRKVLICLALTFACCALATAQKGKSDFSEIEFHPQNYRGDTWTGEVSKVSESGREIELTYTKGDKTETFMVVMPEDIVARFKNSRDDEVYSVVPLAFFGRSSKDKNAGPPLTSTFDPRQLLGQRVTVYYLRKEKKVDGQKEKLKSNELFRIKVHKRK
jgi:hypothetical protein